MLQRLTLIASLGFFVASGYFVWNARSNRLAANPVIEGKKQSADLPRAVVELEPYDLGVMNPGDVRKHRFNIRNEGKGELVLDLGSTTCKCTLAGFDRMRIAPESTGFVELEWHAENPQFRFRQGAVINSNDPAMPQFELMGEGSIRTKFAMQPETAYFADVARNQSRQLNVLLFSQAFTDVEITAIESTLPGIEAKLSESIPTVSPVQETRFQRDVVVTLQPQTKSGHHDGAIRIRYVGRLPDGKKETGVYELPVSYDVVGDVTLHGRNVVGKSLIFGPVSQAVGATKQAYIHVRGENLEGMKLTPVRSTPDFLKVQIGAAERLSPTITRFPLTVEVPANSPVLTFTEDDLAEVELTTTHSDYPTLRFSTSFIVVP